MATLTIRNVPEDMVERIKEKATGRGVSMEEEVRHVLRRQYPAREELIRQVRELWSRVAPVPHREIERLIREGREERLERILPGAVSRPVASRKRTGGDRRRARAVDARKRR